MILTKEKKEFLKLFVELNQNTTKEQKEFLKFTIDTSNTLEELSAKLVLTKLL